MRWAKTIDETLDYMNYDDIWDVEIFKLQSSIPFNTSKSDDLLSVAVNQEKINILDKLLGMGFVSGSDIFHYAILHRNGEVLKWLEDHGLDKILVDIVLIQVLKCRMWIK